MTRSFGIDSVWRIDVTCMNRINSCASQAITVADEVGRAVHGTVEINFSHTGMCSTQSSRINAFPERCHALDKINNTGKGTSQTSMMKTRQMYNMMLFRFLLVSNRSNGARCGTNNNARNSSRPSTLECFTDKWSSRHSLSTKNLENPGKTSTRFKAVPLVIKFTKAEEDPLHHG